jgi:hypothetical protein
MGTKLTLAIIGPMYMYMPEIRKIAKKMGIKAGKLNKTLLVRAIQAEEDNEECFATGDESCDQLTCCWREDCFKLAKKA